MRQRQGGLGVWGSCVELALPYVPIDVVPGIIRYRCSNIVPEARPTATPFLAEPPASLHSSHAGTILYIEALSDMSLRIGWYHRLWG